MKEKTTLQILPSASWWHMSTEAIFKLLKTSNRGLSDKEAQQRKKIHGPNSISKDSNSTIWKIFLRQFTSPLIFILLIALIVSLLLEKGGDALIIGLAVGINVALGFYQEYKAEVSVKHLRSYVKERIRVIRDGQEKEIDAEELVVGDMIRLEGGNRVPADALIISSNNFQTEESILTGESLPVNKQKNILPEETELPDRTNMLYGGTLVLQGLCDAIICATGKKSEIGLIAQLISETKDTKTPLQKSIYKFSWMLTLVLGILVAVLFMIGITKGIPILDMFFIVVAVAVGSIPEGLPIALTAVLSVGVSRLAKRNGIVRRLIAAETLGSVDVIMTDKTGTLTEKKLTVRRIEPYTPNKAILKKEKSIDDLSEEQRRLLLLALINTRTLISQENGNENPIIKGNSLESSLVSYAFDHNIDVRLLKKETEAIEFIPFDSLKKHSIYKIKNIPTALSPILSQETDNIEIYMGAPEVLLERSTLSKEERIRVGEQINKIALQGERVLAVGYISDSENEHSLTWAGIISFFDPPRAEAAAVMKKIKDFGTYIVMVTGDHPGTALAISKAVGLNSSEKRLLTGKQVRELTDEELDERLMEISIYARVTPQDKIRIAQAFKRMGHIVAMTGDGVNDAPALKEADVGVALGSGTDVAKDVADLVLLDDNFTTIISAIEEGRRIMGNIKKTVIYLLSSTLDEVLLIGGSILLGIPLPLTALQILWVNFFSDSFPAIAFAFEKNKDDVLKRTSGNIFDKEVRIFIIIIGVVTSIILFGLYALLSFLGYDPKILQTFIFTAFGLYSLLLAFSLRNFYRPIWSYSPFSNKYMTGGVLIGMVMMVSALYFPPIRTLLSIHPLPLSWLGFALIFVLLNIALAEVIKYFLYKNKPLHY